MKAEVVRTRIWIVRIGPFTGPEVRGTYLSALPASTPV